MRQTRSVAAIEAAVRGIAAHGPDFLTVHGDPQVVRAAGGELASAAVERFHDPALDAFVEAAGSPAARSGRPAGR